MNPSTVINGHKKIKHEKPIVEEIPVLEEVVFDAVAKPPESEFNEEKVAEIVKEAIEEAKTEKPKAEVKKPHESKKNAKAGKSSK